jgi:hypothetical protein
LLAVAVKHLKYTIEYYLTDRMNHKALAIATLAAVLLGSTLVIASGHIAFAHKDKNTKVLGDSRTNLQTDTNQKQDCKTAGGTSPISDSCTAASTDTITQGAAPPPRPPPTLRPTVLTLNPITNPIGPYPATVTVTGKLIDATTGSGIYLGIVEVTGTAFFGRVGGPTETDGTFSFSFSAPVNPGTYTMQAHFAGQIQNQIVQVYGPSDSGIETFTVPP